MLVGSLKEHVEFYYFLLKYIRNYIIYIIALYIHISFILHISSIVSNKREKGVVLSWRTLMKFWTFC